MKIETKFNINDLVQFKHEIQSGKKINLLEIVEILSQACYKESQIFYLCRPVYFEKIDGTWLNYHGVSPNENGTGWKKYREDELSELSDELKAKIEEIKNK